MGVTGRQGRRRKKLLDDVKKRVLEIERRNTSLHTCGPVVRQKTA
jgi:hypothetical protein